MERSLPAKKHPWLLLGGILLLSFFFAKVEIQIEGGAGWAAGLPTWKVDQHWLLDIFWGGRPMTGYHAWVFSFMFLVFHLGMLVHGKWSLKQEARILGSLMIFWIVEDFLWFVLNPYYGLSRFTPALIPWHKKWLWIVPTDYVTFLVLGGLLYWYSFAGTMTTESAAASNAPGTAPGPGGVTPQRRGAKGKAGVPETPKPVLESPVIKQ